MAASKITGANARGPRELPMRARWTARVAQLDVRPEIPFQLQYALTRWQRILAHLRIWLTYLPGAIGAAVMGVFLVFGKR